MVEFYRFRPLDGESISKPKAAQQTARRVGFRPLDGESISKRDSIDVYIEFRGFPSPRRGINF